MEVDDDSDNNDDEAESVADGAMNEDEEDEDENDNDDNDDDDDLESLMEDKEEEDKNRITLQDMRDGVVGAGTKQSYLNDIITFIQWCLVDKPTWLTTYCQDKMTEMEDTLAGLQSRVCCSRLKVFVENLLRDATNQPLVHLRLITPESYMGYIEQCHNAKTGK
jgi:hypothetical protein